MKVLPCLFLLICCLSCSPKNGVVPPEKWSILPAQIKLIEKSIQPFPSNSEVAIALIKNGEIGFIGLQKAGKKVERVDNQTSIFEIGSISKVFTAILLANLVEKGKLKLDASIQDYLDLEWKTTKKISFQQLSNHTSGLPRLPTNLYLDQVDADNPYKDYGKQQLEKYLSEEMELAQAPGTQNAYSNLGAGLLGYLMTQVTKQEYETLLQQYIANKYGMSNTTTLRGNVEDKLIKGQNPDGEITANWDLNILVGAGGVLSSTEDLTKFALAHFNTKDAVLKQTQVPTFTLSPTMKIGLGWHLIQEESGREMIWHNGGTGGYTSSMALDIENQDGVIILSNISAFHPEMGNLDRLCFGLMNTL